MSTATTTETRQTAQAAAFTGDPGIHHDPRRRDWIELNIAAPGEVERLRPLFEQSIAANG